MNTSMSEYADRPRRSQPKSYAVTPHDQELIDFIADYHGCGKSEAVRQSVRFYAERVAKLKEKTAGV